MNAARAQAAPFIVQNPTPTNHLNDSRGHGRPAAHASGSASRALRDFLDKEIGHDRIPTTVQPGKAMTVKEMGPAVVTRWASFEEAFLGLGASLYVPLRQGTQPHTIASPVRAACSSRSRLTCLVKRGPNSR